MRNLTIETFTKKFFYTYFKIITNLINCSVRRIPFTLFYATEMYSTAIPKHILKQAVPYKGAE